MHKFNSFKKLKFSHVLVNPSNNWKKKKDKLEERKILTFSSLKSPTAIDESLNEKRSGATVAIFNTKFFSFQLFQLFCSAHTVQRVQKYDRMGGRFIFSPYLCKRISQNKILFHNQWLKWLSDIVQRLTEKRFLP